MLADDEGTLCSFSEDLLRGSPDWARIRGSPRPRIGGAPDGGPGGFLLARDAGVTVTTDEATAMLLSYSFWSRWYCCCADVGAPEETDCDVASAALELAGFTTGGDVGPVAGFYRNVNGKP